MRQGRRASLASSLVAVALGLSGCAGLARGITEGLMGRQGQESIDTKQCHVRGPAFEGLESSMQRQEEIAKTDIPEPRSSLKVLMVHGIGDHIPVANVFDMPFADGEDVHKESFERRLERMTGMMWPPNTSELASSIASVITRIASPMSAAEASINSAS